MAAFIGPVVLAFGAVFIAELGDKTQLLILAFATRYRAAPVIAGLVAAALVIQGISVAIGSALGAALPAHAVALVAGAAFLAVAAWTLRVEGDEGRREITGNADGRGWLRIAAMVAVAFFVAELGDKSMLATFALASQQGPIPTWIGSTAGEVGANLLAVAVGRQVGTRLSPRAIRIGSAALFAIAGVLLVFGAVAGG
jgi:putative Ca2+/H+ antiporter (TMEM165/GDT1 family)